MKGIKNSISLLIATVALLLGSCDTPLKQKTEELGISTTGAYQGSAKIYFDQSNTADTLVSYSFGANPIEVHSYVVKVPLRVIGDKSGLPRAYQVEVVKDKTTAQSGVHYTPLQQTYQFRAGEYTDTLRIELLRDALSPDQAKPDTLTIRLVSTDDLSVAFEAHNQVMVTFDNYLAEPSTWGYYVYFMGAYSRIKYIKLLEAYDNDENKFWNGIMSWTDWILNVRNVRDYFLAHPEYGINDIPDPSAFVPFIE